MDKRAINKICKLLRLAQSDNPHEAANAMRHAKAMMKKHGISEDDIQLSEVKETETTTSSQNTPAHWMRVLASTVADAFGCRYFFRETWGTNSVVFIGVRPHNEVAAYTFTHTAPSGNKSPLGIP